MMCAISAAYFSGWAAWQVDLVEHRDDREVVLQGQVQVGQRLRLDALGGVDEEDRALAGGQRPGHLVGEVDVAGVSIMSSTYSVPGCAPERGVQGRRTFCALMVMPRSRSMSMRSRYWARMFRPSTMPVTSSMRSASVDLPWSMWAMMQKFRMSAGSVAAGVVTVLPSSHGTRSGRATAASAVCRAVSGRAGRGLGSPGRRWYLGRPVRWRGAHPALRLDAWSEVLPPARHPRLTRGEHQVPDQADPHQRGRRVSATSRCARL